MVDAAPTTRFERLRLVLVALSVLLPPVVLRVHLLGTADRGAAMPLDDLAGFIADFGVSGLVGILLLLALRLSAGLGLGVLALWIAVNLVAYESIHALDALPSFRDAGYLTDATFLQGSGWGALRSGLALWVALASLGLGWAGRKAAVAVPYLLAAVVVSGLVLGLHSGLAWSPAVADWRQTHTLLHNWTDAVAGPPPLPADTDLAAVASGLAADLSGESRIGARPSAPNVLLVLVESISGAYLSTTAEAHGRSPRPSMPRLDAFAREHTAYATFLTHQINTNRGVYAALCGDLPKLLPGTPKMSALAATGRDGCLPQILRDAGYRTIYLQAAPLAFMLKDQFLPRIGFDRVLGAGSFPEARARSAWGVDDGTFFEAATRLVRQLQQQVELHQERRPWFTTLLTVGTHHPYLVPADFAPNMEDDFERAVAYADQEVARFLEAITRMGVLEDTLVLVSSDESRGLRGEADPISLITSQSWGLLVTAGPGIGTERVDEPFASSDLPLSVVDYLSLTGAGLHSKLLGRSVFRVQSRSRYVFFGNTRRNALGAIDPEGRLLLCRRRFQHCEAFELPQGVFSSRRRRVPWRAEEGGVVAAAAAFSLTSGAPAAPLETLELMAEKQIEVDGRPRMLHGGQNVRLAPGEWIEVELSVAAEGVAGLELRHILRDPLRGHLDETRRLPVGHHLELAYTFVPEKPVNKIQCMSMARALAGGEGADGEGAGGGGANGGGKGSGASGAGPTTLTFKTARMHLRSSGERPPPGLTILRDDVRPSTGP